MTPQQQESIASTSSVGAPGRRTDDDFHLTPFACLHPHTIAPYLAQFQDRPSQPISPRRHNSTHDCYSEPPKNDAQDVLATGSGSDWQVGSIDL